MKTLQLILVILSASYLTGLGWFILSDLMEDAHSEDNFIKVYMMREQPSWVNSIALTYFAFTSFSTVGLGDFNPKSNMERLVCSFLLLFGVAMTSFIMDNLNNMLLKLNQFNKDFEDESKLS